MRVLLKCKGKGLIDWGIGKMASSLSRVGGLIMSLNSQLGNQGPKAWGPHKIPDLQQARVPPGMDACKLLRWRSRSRYFNELGTYREGSLPSILRFAHECCREFHFTPGQAI
ncbi:hypothetical protein GOP47_0022515 [Adiantum capillus-veneris]|uniref:Uncharacterized protein n=1 Tax=Adiantum capillus-veneris TaxID=13818 RepID=A0A9D4Z6X3_ADICA|nr:hypothetical protein GOP47_0022515 [Adiantum capillus-veneris]